MHDLISDPAKRAHQTEPLSISFPTKLHLLLGAERLGTVLGWLPGGTCWAIHNLDAFIELLPSLALFDGMEASSTLDSFARQLSLWNFRLVAAGPSFAVYNNRVSDAFYGDGSRA